MLVRIFSEFRRFPNESRLFSHITPFRLVGFRTSTSNCKIIALRSVSHNVFFLTFLETGGRAPFTLIAGIWVLDRAIGRLGFDSGSTVSVLTNNRMVWGEYRSRIHLRVWFASRGQHATKKLFRVWLAVKDLVHASSEIPVTFIVISDVEFLPPIPLHPTEHSLVASTAAHVSTMILPPIHVMQSGTSSRFPA